MTSDVSFIAIKVSFKEQIINGDSKLNSIKENIHDTHDMLNEISSNINEINFLECLMKGE